MNACGLDLAWLHVVECSVEGCLNMPKHFRDNLRLIAEDPSRTVGVATGSRRP